MQLTIINKTSWNVFVFETKKEAINLIKNDFIFQGVKQEIIKNTNNFEIHEQTAFATVSDNVVFTNGIDIKEEFVTAIK